MNKPVNKYYFTTRDLLLIAIIGCLGGVLSTYVGYLGTTLGNLTGIPFSGQLISGIHVLWVVLIMAMVDKKGSGILAGLLKGFVEFVSGSHLGLFVIIISVVEGIFAEIGFWPLKKYRTLSYLLAGGLASWANIMVQQALWDKFGTAPLFGLVSVFAIISGIIFGGYFALGIAGTLYGTSIIRKPQGWSPAKVSAPLLAMVLLISVAAVYLSIQCLQPASASEEQIATAGSSPVFTISGSVDRGQNYTLDTFRDRYVTVNAQKNDHTAGTRDYTGVPLRLVLQDAGLQANSTKVDVIGSDGFRKTFQTSDIMSSGDMILVDDGGDCLLVAPEYQTSMWVRHIDKIHVY